jgi:hypothetical protein
MTSNCLGVHPNTGGMVVFGCCAGLAFPISSGLEHGVAHANESGPGCTHDGCMEKKAKWLGNLNSDQGTQFGSDEFSRWCKDNRLSPSMSRRSNCWDNAVAESLFSIFSSLKSERVKKRIYSTRAEAKSEIFDYIEGFYNRVRRHKHLDQLSPLEFERRQTAL